MVAPQEALRIEKRLEDLKRGGVHRIKDNNPMPSAMHVVGVGKAGADFITQMIRQALANFLEDDRKCFTALAVNVGDLNKSLNLLQVGELAKTLPSDCPQVRTLALEVPSRDELLRHSYGVLRQSTGKAA